MTRTYLIALCLCILSLQLYAQTESGELKKWHTVTIEFTDDGTYSETGTPNPFLDRRLNVTLTAPSGNTYVVPGYFAADGNAAETSANSGNKWHCKFSADEIGLWTYAASFREGSAVAVQYPSSPSDGSAGAINGQSGSFSVAASDKSGRDFRGKGRLVYDGTRYPKFADTGKAFIKAGPDSPENFLAYLDFDAVYTYAAPDRRKNYSSHISDWQSGDPAWQGTKGRGMIGAINYLSTVGMNSISFLTMNKIAGDTKDVTMHVDQPGLPLNSYLNYDVSRLAQWEIVFEHAQTKGLFLHFKTQEQENATQLNGGLLGTDRKLYYRELIARYGHHLALNWNMGEENEPQNTSQRIAQLAYVKDIDPYDHLRVVHSGGSNSNQDAMYNPLLGSSSELTGISLQVLFQFNHDRVKYWVDQSKASGKEWPLSSDETGTGGEDNQANREEKLYGTYFAGGYGVEYYFQGEDFTIQNFRSGDKQGIWEKSKYALDFMDIIPFIEMEGDNSIVSGNDNMCFYKNNDTYAIYLPDGSDNPTLDINNTGDTFSIEWFDPRNGGSLQNGSVTSITSTGTPQNIGLPPNSSTSDWVALITNNSSTSDPELSINNVTVEEGNNAIFTVTLTNSASGSFSVDYSTASNTATSGTDFTANSGTLNFSGTAGETETITIVTTDDASVETDEQFFVNLSNATGGVSIVDSQGIGTITDDDTSANLTINDVVVTEGGNAVFTVLLDNNVGTGFTVDFATADISATSGEDYILATGSISFAGTAGETQTITVSTVDNTVFESTEQFAVNIATSSSVNVQDGQGLATINDDDTASISINNASATEGNSTTFTVTLDNTVSIGFSVDFSSASNTASSGLDFTANSGTLNFVGTAGETQSITINTINDAILEGTESFFVDLSNATAGVSISDAQGLGTITDNDAASISINDITVSEGNSAVFTVTLDNAVSGGFNVDFGSANNTATSGSDFSSNSGTINFVGTAGETQSIVVNTVDDAIVESTESFFVNLSNSTNGVSIADSQGTGTITDNDTASISINNTTVTEGNNATLVISLDNAISGGFSVDFSTAGNTATQGVDFTSNSGTLNFAGTAGETQTIIVNTINDASVESSESFFVNLSNATNGVTIADSQGIVTLVDDDSSNIFISDSSSSEGNALVFDVSLSAGVSGGFSVDYTTAGNTATTGVDFTSNSGTLNFAGTAGEIQTITINSIDDSLLEGTESFFVNLSNATNGVNIADSQGLGTITDNDTASLTINNITVSEGNSTVLVVTLDNAVSGGFSVDFSTASNSATEGADFTASSGTLNFVGTAGETQSISVTTIDDAILEGTESFFVDLSNATNGVSIADGQGAGTITDNDSASISIGDTGVTEGNSAVLTVTLNNAVGGGFSVDYSTIGNSATQAVDFSFTSGTLNFTGSAGETQTITVSTNDDSVVENTESFFVNLSNATSGVNIADAQAIVTLLDNDNTSDIANITVNDIEITEGDNATFTVTLDDDVSGGFTVNYSFNAETAVEGTDFVGMGGTLAFTGVSGETQTIIVLTLDDTEVENDESFTVNLSNATNSVNILDPLGRAIISDNDSDEEETVSITISDGEAQEGGSIIFEVTLSRVISEDLLLLYEIINESASNEDYNTDINSLMIEAGETTGQIVVTLLSDSEIEGDETFSIRLIDPANSIIVLADDIAIGTILDANSESENEMILFPVPLQKGNDLSLDRVVDGNYFLSVYTHTGQLLYQNEITVTNNSYSFSLDASLSSGFFLLKMANVTAGIEYEKVFIISR